MIWDRLPPKNLNGKYFVHNLHQNRKTENSYVTIKIIHFQAESVTK